MWSMSRTHSAISSTRRSTARWPCWEQLPDQADGHVNPEEDWNTRSSLTRNPYYYSKLLAERAAWEFMDNHQTSFDLVVINPFLVIGPSLVPGVNASARSLVALTTGGMPGILGLQWPP